MPPPRRYSDSLARMQLRALADGLPSVAFGPKPSHYLRLCTGAGAGAADGIILALADAVERLGFVAR